MYSGTATVIKVIPNEKLAWCITCAHVVTRKEGDGTNELKPISASVLLRSKSEYE